MRSIRIYFAIILFSSSFPATFCQNERIDSLKNILSSDSFKEESTIYLDLANELISVSPTDALTYLKAGIKFSQKENNSSNLARAKRIYGKYYLATDKIDSAILKFSESLGLFKKLGNTKEEAATLSNIATVYFKQGDLDKAVEIYSEALEVFKRIGDTGNTSFVLNNLGMIYLNKKQYSSAIDYFEQSLTIKESLKDEIGIAHTLCNLGHAYSYIGKNQKARELMLRALDTFSFYDLKYEIALTSLNIGDYYNRENDFEKSKVYYGQALENARKTGSKDIQWEVYRELSGLYDNLGEYRQALKYYQLFSELKDSVLSADNNKMIKEFRVKFDTERKEYQINLLDRENNINIEKLNHRTTILIFTIFAILLLFIFIFIFFFQHRRLSTAYKVLVRNNIELLDKQKKIEKFSTSIMPDQTNSTEQITDLKSRLVKLIEVDKVYEEKDLTIFRLADIMETNKTYLSKLINEEYKQNFNTFINTYRIKEAIRLLSDGVQKKYTIAYIAEKVGFNSLSVFNKAFKENTGLTPTYYIKVLRTESYKQSVTD